MKYKTILMFVVLATICAAFAKAQDMLSLPPKGGSSIR